MIKTAFRRLVTPYLQIIKGQFTGVIKNENNKVDLNNAALVFDDAAGSTTNIDHLWHDDSNNVHHFCSDTTLKALGNSTLTSKAAAYTGGVIELHHVAERFDAGSHTRLWRIVTGIRKSDLHMFNVNISGYGYGLKGLVDINIGGYCYLNARILNTFAVSRGTHHCDYAWLGFDSSDRLNIFVGDGISKYYSGVTLDVKLHHGRSSQALTDFQLVNPANWQIVDSPTGNPGTATTWSGITDIVRVAVTQG